MIKACGISGYGHTVVEQVGYSIADIVAGAVFGVLIWAIANARSSATEKNAFVARAFCLFSELTFIFLTCDCARLVDSNF